MVVINDLDDFKKAVSEHDLCLVKIGTQWCGPCKMVQKNIEDIEKFYTDVYFIEVDADSADDIVDEFGVRSVPVVLLIENGEVIYKSTGLLTQTQLKDLLN